jgi:hypothetical protein
MKEEEEVVVEGAEIFEKILVGVVNLLYSSQN